MADKNADFLVDNGTAFEKYNFSTTAEQVNHGTTTVAAELEALDGHNHDDRYYTEAEVDSLLSKALSGALKIQAFSSAEVTIPGGSGGSFDKFNSYSVPNGYKAVGIVGFQVYNAFVQPFKVTLTPTLKVDVYNTDSNARKTNASVTVLFAKTSVM